MILKNLGKIFIFFLLFQVVLFAKFELKQTVSKDTIYLNETIKVSLKLSFENNESELIDLVAFDEYESIDFWHKLHTNQTKKQEGSKWVYTYEYLIEPKKAGRFTLPEQLFKVSSYQIRKKKRFQRIYSNKMDIKVLPLVNNIPIQGQYKIDFSVDKTLIKPNESVRGKLFIKGNGNIQDINKYELNLLDQTVYSDELIVENIFKKTFYEGNATQQFLIISDKSFTIPSFRLEYYNPSTNVIEIQRTKPIFIEVEKEIIEEKDEVWLKYLFLIFGIVIGVFVFKYYKKLLNMYKKKQIPLYKMVQQTKDKKELYTLLIKFNSSKRFNHIIEELENDIYLKKITKSFKELKKVALKTILFESV
jgi:hypothetical protein